MARQARKKKSGGSTRWVRPSSLVDSSALYRLVFFNAVSRRWAVSALETLYLVDVQQSLEPLVGRNPMALAVAITFVTTRPWWERIVIVISAIPIAVAVNITRITVTGVLYLTVDHEIAEFVFHDFAGWLMMPLALGLLYLEVQILSHLFIEEDQSLLGLGLGNGGRR